MANDAGIYTLTSDQTSLNTVGEHLVYNSELRACAGVTLSAGALIVSPERYVLNYGMSTTRTAGSAGDVLLCGLHQDPAGTPKLVAGGTHTYNRPADATIASCPQGGGLNHLNTAEQMSIGVNILALSAGSTHTAIARHTFMVIMKLESAPVDFGLYNRTTDQTSISATNTHLVVNNTLRGCSGVTQSSGVYTFGGGGLYVVQFGTRFTRTAGSAGSTIEAQWSTDPTGSPVLHPDSVRALWVCHDASTQSGSQVGAIGVIDASSGDVTIGPTVSALTGTPTFTMTGTQTHVNVIRIR